MNAINIHEAKTHLSRLSLVEVVRLSGTVSRPAHRDTAKAPLDRGWTRGNEPKASIHRLRSNAGMHRELASTLGTLHMGQRGSPECGP